MSASRSGSTSGTATSSTRWRSATSICCSSCSGSWPRSSISAGVGVAIQLHVKRRLQINWRTWLSRTTVHRWLHSGRQYQLGLLADDIDNPDGRIAEDIRVSTELAVEFAQSILQCILQLCHLPRPCCGCCRATMPIHLFGREFNIPGYMVWCAVAYALIGSLLTYALGRGLIDAGNVRQGREADFRSVLTRAREHAEGIALMRGEDDERERLRGSLFDLRTAWNRQTRGQGSLSLLTSSLAYLAPIVPLIVALPRYLSGQIQLGGLMQTAQAFSSVQWALSWLIDNFPKFAEWRASTNRVVHLHVALTDLEESAEATDGERITVHAASEDDRLIMRELGVARPDGEMLVADAEVEIRRPERVLIRGQSGSGKSTIMRAVAGVWPWGRGAIHLPTGKITFMPQKPYFPLGTLRDALHYPVAPEGITDEVLKDDAAQGRPRPSARPARRDRALGPHPVGRRAAAGRLRPHPDPQARLDLHGRGDLGARRGGPGERHEAPDRGAARDLGGQHRPSAGPRSLPYPRADPGAGRGGRQAGDAEGDQRPALAARCLSPHVGRQPRPAPHRRASGRT